MRLCCMCHEWKPEADFAFRSLATGERQGHCRMCHAAYRRRHYLANRELYIRREIARMASYRLRNRFLLFSYLIEHPCIDCGNPDVLVLEFDHIDPTNKRDTVTRLAASKPWHIVLFEIEKCQVRCANCHRRRTAMQQDWSKRSSSDSEEVVTETITSPPRAAPVRTLVQTCRSCRRVKAFTEFAIKNRLNGLRSTLCRECQRVYGREHYQRTRASYLRRGQVNKSRYRMQNRARVAEYLSSHPCVDCGLTDLLVLEFDHRDGRAKEDEVARLIGTGQWAKLQAEIAKCDVRCANCHRRKTAIQLGWTRAVLQSPVALS